MAVDSEVQKQKPPKPAARAKAPGGALAKRAKSPRAARARRDPTPVRAQLAQKLRRLITDGIYKAGDRMTERELCERRGVSRPSVRQSLRQLQAEGLID